MVSLLKQSTLINYNQEVLSANILHVMKNSDTTMAIFVDQTPFHPLDYQWQDQPADRGLLAYQNQEFEVIDCIIAAKNISEDTVHFANNIPVKRGDPDWLFFVAHIIDIDVNKNQLVTLNNENSVLLKIDSHYRHSLSQIHTACHLASLALNKVVKHYWKKPIDILDSLGNPNLDVLAIAESRILPEQSQDVYHFGKSIRKKGYDSASFFANIEQIEKNINLQLQTWSMNISAIKLSPLPSLITEKRFWQCQLLDGKVSIPCGGTHITHFAPQQKIQVSLTVKNDSEVIMKTSLIAGDS